MERRKQKNECAKANKMKTSLETIANARIEIGRKVEINFKCVHECMCVEQMQKNECRVSHFFGL